MTEDKRSFEERLQEVQETISRSDTSQPTSHLYHVTALLNQEQKFVRMNITL